MRIAPDTNVLIRSAVRDDPAQAALAISILKDATSIAVSSTALCEFAWVLRGTYRFTRVDVATAIRNLLDIEIVMVDRAAVAAGLAMLDAGGDFADGIIAHEGLWLGAEVFVSFDRNAAKRLQDKGLAVQLLA